MRESKFRAKYLPNENDEPPFSGWLYGGGVLTLSNGKTAMFHLNSEGLPTVTLVITESVSEWTGLKDEDENDIYEADVVKGRYFQGPGTVVASIEFKNGSFLMNNTPILQYLHRKILGNIYENPELLVVDTKSA